MPNCACGKKTGKKNTFVVELKAHWIYISVFNVYVVRARIFAHKKKWKKKKEIKNSFSAFSMNFWCPGFVLDAFYLSYDVINHS